MWNEQSTEIAITAKSSEEQKQNLNPAEVAWVKKGSIGEDLGFEPGDRLVSINGIKPRDLIDYKYLIVEEELSLEVLSIDGRLHYIELEKDQDDDLGLAFTEALFDGLRQCNNNCPFCFIDQQPPGKRSSLYLKDDDYRLSFLYGSYLTLTNLTQSDWSRIEKQRLSPLFVSIHSTDSKIRSRLLKNPRAALLMDQLHWFTQRKLQIHSQIVVCPGINDGESLEKTVRDLASFRKASWPTVLSTAVVPVGLTRFRPEGDGLRPVDEECARTVINQIEPLQEEFKKSLGSRFAWLSDEWYLIAKKALPPIDIYEDLPQQENGVGSIRAFLESIEKATAILPETISNQRAYSWIVGKLVENALAPIAARLNKINGLQIHLYGLPSQYWGTEQVVTGLLTGQDILEGLKNQDLGDELLLPSMVLKEGQPIFLDDMTLEELSKSLNVKVRIVHGAEDIVAAALEQRAEIH